MATISQREAHRLRKRVAELELLIDGQRKSWSRDWPGGTHILTVTAPGAIALAAVHTARQLRHAVVVLEDGDNLQLYALPAPRVPL